MTYLEELIEAIDYSQTSGCNWWEVFESLEEAEDILDGAVSEDPDDGQVAFLISTFEDGEIFVQTPYEEYKRCLRRLKQQLKRAHR